MAGAYLPSSPPRQPRYGLVAAVGGEAAIRQFMAANPAEGDPERWAGPEGYAFNPYDCASETAAFRMDCGHNPTFTQSNWPAAVTGFAFGIWDSVKCSTLGMPQAADIERATQKLLTSTSHKLEREFWKGTVAQDQAASTAYLAQAGQVTEPYGTAAVPLPYAFAFMADALGDCGQGARSMIHVTTATAVLLMQQYVIRVENGLLLDAFGNIVVAGSGYDGSSPTGVVDATTDTAWMYGTTIVDVRLSSIDNQHVVDQTNNVDRALAWRAGAVTWDGCCHIGINADLCQPFCSPG